MSLIILLRRQGTERVPASSTDAFAVYNRRKLSYLNSYHVDAIYTGIEIVTN